MAGGEDSWQSNGNLVLVWVFKPRKLYVCIQTNILSPENTSNVFYTTQGIISEIMDITKNPISTESEKKLMNEGWENYPNTLTKFKGYYRMMHLLIILVS